MHQELDSVESNVPLVSISAAASVTTLLDVNKHIMISYNKETRDLCLRIKSELEEAGFSVWIDIENIHGSSLESMSQAIEDSELVLICMNQKYKESLNCRAEAEYVYQIRKPFIPLIMESGYKPNGWLGILLGSRIYVDFTKYEFAECMRRLRKEIVVIYDHVYDFLIKSQSRSHSRSQSLSSMDKLLSQLLPQVVTSGAATRSHSPLDENSTLSSLTRSLGDVLSTWCGEICDRTEWSETEVDAWVEEKKFPQSIIESVRPSNGKLLYSMFKMSESAPESFYASLNKKDASLTLRDLVFFSTELKNLFSL
jgi:hypothetical protein